MTGPGRPSKKWKASSGTADLVVAERIDVGPVSPVPVSYGRPESPTVDERVSVGPPSALSERVDVGPASPLTERQSIAPTSAFDERVNVGPTSALDERASVAPPMPGTLSSREAMSETPGTVAKTPGAPGPGGRWASARARSTGTVAVTIGAGIRAAAGGRAATQGGAGTTASPEPVTAPARPSTPTPDRSAVAKIRVMFRDYQTIKDPQQKQVLRTTLLALCKMVLPEKNDPRRARYIDAETALVGDIHAVLDRDKGQAKAQARYVTDAYAGGPSPGSTQSPTKLTAWKQQDVSSVLQGAAALHSGTSLQMGDEDDLKMVEKYGLTHAEIVAVRAYTAANYEYINPATENNRRGGGHDRQPGEDEKSVAWMKAQNKKRDSTGTVVDLDPAELEAHFAEGSLHAGVLMMALNKLEDKKGHVVSRGAADAQRVPRELCQQEGVQDQHLQEQLTEGGCGSGLCPRK